MAPGNSHEKKAHFFPIRLMKFQQRTFRHSDEITEVREKTFDSVATDVLGNAIKTKISSIRAERSAERWF